MRQDVHAAWEAAVRRLPSEEQGNARWLWSDVAANLEQLGTHQGMSDGPPVPISPKPVQQQLLNASAAGEAGGSRLERVVRQLADALTDAFFLSPHSIIAADGESVSRLLIGFIPTDVLREFVTYVDDFPRTGTGELRFGVMQVTAMSDFLSTWLAGVCDAIPPRSVGSGADQDPRARVYNEGVPAATGGGAAFARWKSELEQLRRRFEGDRAVAVVADRVAGVIEEVEQDVAALRRTVGQVGDDSLATHFADLDRDEHKRARVWTWITGAGVLGTIALAVGVLAGWVRQDAGWAAELVHLAVTLPAAAGTAYASTIGSRHRQHAWWAGVVAAQLHTFDAFSAPLPEESRNALRAEFGAQLFCAPPFNADPDQKPDSASITAAVPGLIGRPSNRNG